MENDSRIFQGASRFTERKEFEIGGIARMRLMQLKSESVAPFYSRIVISDVFSGSGENVIDPHEDPIDGSPLRLLWGLEAAIQTKSGPKPMALERKTIEFLFSDIRSEAIAHLNNVIADRGGAPAGAHVTTATMDASSAINMLRLDMKENLRTHLILVLDPNGPKAFPRDEVLELLGEFSGRIDLIPYISATAVNRCLNHKAQCGATYDWWLSAVDRFDTGFVHAIASGRNGWIREPMTGDPQKWLMLPTFTPKLVPRNDWSKQGYVAIDSPRGEAAIQHYSNTRAAA